MRALRGDHPEPGQFQLYYVYLGQPSEKKQFVKVLKFIHGLWFSWPGLDEMVYETTLLSPCQCFACGVGREQAIRRRLESNRKIGTKCV